MRHPLISENRCVQGALGRPGNLYQDSLSAISNLGPDNFVNFHTYGVDWLPGQVCVHERELARLGRRREVMSRKEYS